ncbi:hypothetical protein GF359_08965 [candidate division WOR-3 bacterium]|uniref:STAS domain-containing protein n=1 Tax=candidate division WOR-3 bacterium TaxID=2052148 RepID=A0A9D5KAW4_UNCW3|nr:hypothetical protein [candidate division WOR-3 bacterium]MBD3365330.1 hypothetical protein [candidate division WOR-3 bacterium]
MVKHHAWLDKKNNLLWIRIMGFCGLAELDKLFEDSRRLLEVNDTSHVAIDISAIEGFPDEDVRNRIALGLSAIEAGRVAVISGRPQINVVAEFIAKDIAVYADARSFMRKVNALSWLKRKKAKKLTGENLQPGIA